MIATETEDAAPGYLTIMQVAAQLSVSRKTLERWIRDGKVPVVRLPSGRVRVRVADVVKEGA